MAWVTNWRWPEAMRSLRWRVAAALAALALLTILAQSLAWLWLLERQEDAFINQQLQEQMAHSMALWREHLFSFMARLARPATLFFGLPPGRVVEMSSHVEL